MPYRQSQWRTDITIDGVGNVGGQAAKAWEGAGADADTSVYQRASGAVQLGGAPTRDDGTATYLYDEVLHAQWKAIEAAQKRSARARITRTPVSDDGTPFTGGGFTMTGVVKGCTLPASDYASSDGAEAQIVFAVDAPLA